MLKRLIFAAVVALVAVPAALAATPSTNSQNAARTCTAIKAAMTAPTFKQTYGTNADKSNAFGVCVSRMEPQITKAEQTASAQCKAEQADTGFAAAHNGKTFAQFYGSGKKSNDAFGKCVAKKTQALMAVVVAKQLNGARACKAELKATGSTAFAAKYGKNGNKKNAFGKCVVAYVKAH